MKLPISTTEVDPGVLEHFLDDAGHVHVRAIVLAEDARLESLGQVPVQRHDLRRAIRDALAGETGDFEHVRLHLTVGECGVGRVGCVSFGLLSQ